jgi:hypothetical protein
MRAAVAGGAALLALGALLVAVPGQEPAPAMSVGVEAYAVAWGDWSQADRDLYCQAWAEEPELFRAQLLPTFNAPAAEVEAFLAVECAR